MMKRKAEEKMKKEEETGEEQLPTGEAGEQSSLEEEKQKAEQSQDDSDIEEVLIEDIETVDDGPAMEENKEESLSLEEELDADQKWEAILKEKKELEDRCLRLMADFDNFKKRVSKEKADSIKYANESFIKDILPAVDNIERVLSFDFEKIEGKPFKEGIELVLSEIKKTFLKYGVEVIEAVGNPFDPTLHEAMQSLEIAGAEPDTVVEEFQKGYLYHGRLLRPAMVIVAAPEAKPAQESEEPSQDDEEIDADLSEETADKKDNSDHN